MQLGQSTGVMSEFIGHWGLSSAVGVFSSGAVGVVSFGLLCFQRPLRGGQGGRQQVCSKGIGGHFSEQGEEIIGRFGLGFRYCGSRLVFIFSAGYRCVVLMKQRWGQWLRAVHYIFGGFYRRGILSSTAPMRRTGFSLKINWLEILKGRARWCVFFPFEEGKVFPSSRHGVDKRGKKRDSGS